MGTNCQSCGMPLSPEMKRNESYCIYCSDESGSLRSREEVKAGIAQWLEGFAPEVEGVNFSERAEKYLQSMPTWA